MSYLYRSIWSNFKMKVSFKKWRVGRSWGWVCGSLFSTRCFWQAVVTWSPEKGGHVNRETASHWWRKGWDELASSDSFNYRLWKGIYSYLQCDKSPISAYSAIVLSVLHPFRGRIRRTNQYQSSLTPCTTCIMSIH